MPIQTDAPNGQGAYSQWGLWGSAPSKIAAVATSDGDTSVVYAASGGKGVWDSYTFPLLTGITDPVTAASVGTVIREYAHGAGHLMFMLWANALSWDNATALTKADVVHYAGGYTTISYSAAGGQLALASVNSQHGIAFSGAGGPSNQAEFWATQVYRTVNYAFGAVGGQGEQFEALLIPLVVGLLGSNLLLQDMGAVSRALGRIRLRKDEYEAAWLALKGYKSPAWSI